jgi:hypothetical protein
MDTTDNLQEVLILYPPRPGFTLLAHHILGDMTKYFGLIGWMAENPQPSLVIFLAEAPVFTSSDDAQSINRREVFKAVSALRTPLTPWRKEKTEQDPDLNQWNSCLCSGE